jgi:hypothetical protein
VHEKSRKRLTLPALWAAMMLTGCGGLAVSATTETERAICRELARDLPTYSERDTPATLAAGARFVAVFEAVCGG